MIPYIYSSRKIKETYHSINCNADLIILDGNIPILISLIDIAIKTKKVAADLIADSYSSVILKNRKNVEWGKELIKWQNKFRYKSDRQGDLTHTMIYNTKINDYCIDWNNEGKSSIITKYLRNKKYLPVTEEIVEKIITYDNKNNSKYSSNIFSECKVYTINPIFENLKVYKINEIWFKEKLSTLKLFTENKEFNWDKIETIEDYLFTFLKPIKEKLSKSINILFNPKKIHTDIANSKFKPFKGQIPVIQSGVEILKKDKFVYLASEMGCGKTFCGTKVNHLYHKLKNKKYITLIVAPAITLTQWKQELKNSIADNIDVHIIKKTNEFIKWYNQSNMKVDKPTYFIVGKETFKLGYKKIAGVNIKTRNIKRKEIIYKGYYNYEAIEEVDNKITVATCPNCGLPIKNILRKKEDIFFTKKDFKGNPKKSNYKCNNCGSVLWQSTYNKTKKTSVVDFIKRKNILFDSIIVDEAHEGNRNSLIGSAIKTLIRNHGKKIILLSGTSNNGYSSSLYNLCMALMPRTLKNNEIIDEDKFIKTYGTLMAVNKIKDGEYRVSGRNEIKDNDFKEIEGINPIFFTKYLAQNFIFSTLDDLKSDLPNLIENYIPIQQNKEMEYNENKLLNNIKSTNAFNAQWYNDTIVKHYINNPYNWNSITISKGDITKDIQPTNLIQNILLPKEKELIKIVKKELSQNRKCWIYTDFTGGGEYMKGENIPNRLKRILTNERLKVYHLKASTSTYDRKDIIEKNKNKYDIFISNPNLVKVGLNMVWCPNYIVYIPSYHVNIISQAIRRGYRINSTQENHIYHLYYKNSFENIVAKRYQRKRAEAEAITGKFNAQIENEKVRTVSKLGKRINEGISN